MAFSDAVFFPQRGLFSAPGGLIGLSVGMVSGPPVVWLAVMSVAVLAVAAFLTRLAGRAPFGVYHRFIPALHLVAWLVIAALWLRSATADSMMERFGLLAMVGLLGLAALPWLRNLVHGTLSALGQRYRVGDHLRVGTAEGRLVAISPVSVVLRAADGTEVAIPHVTLATARVVRLNLEQRDAPCELTLYPPEVTGLEVESAIELARQAAALSPYAAPRLPPTVWVVSDGPAFHLVVVGFVFDRDHEQRYRSDVEARFMRSCRELAAGSRVAAPASMAH